MMRNKYVILIIGLLLQWYCCAPLHADNRGTVLGGGGTNLTRVDHNGLRTGTHSVKRHMFGVYAEAAYSSMLFYNPDVCELPMGYGYGGGICYDYQRYYFKMQIGLGIRMQDMKVKVHNFFIYDDQVSDAWGYPYHLKYDFYNRTDYFRKMHFQLPILFGTGDKNLYALAGFKLNLTAYSDMTIQSVASTTAVYDQFLGKFEEMDNHGLRKYVPITTHMQQWDIATKPFKQLYWDVLASIEFGGEWGSKYRPILSRYRPVRQTNHETEWHVRVAAFCDMGLLNTLKSENELVHIPSDYKWDFNRFQQNHVLTTNVPHTPSHLHNFYAGIKVTVFIGFLDYIHCVLCEKYDSEKTLIGH